MKKLRFMRAACLAGLLGMLVVTAGVSNAQEIPEGPDPALSAQHSRNH